MTLSRLPGGGYRPGSIDRGTPSGRTFVSRPMRLDLMKNRVEPKVASELCFTGILKPRVAKYLCFTGILRPRVAKYTCVLQVF